MASSGAHPPTTMALASGHGVADTPRATNWMPMLIATLANAMPASVASHASTNATL
ncbi:hypothetical protein [Burkholderia cepacia]|uniref:hypothetical protein n=1 Tax=Burkholderia TaxID=32008 RepID=UPI0012D9BC2E|nr:hypothetical protein [Burkholderia cepacia]